MTFLTLSGLWIQPQTPRIPGSAPIALSSNGLWLRQAHQLDQNRNFLASLTSYMQAGLRGNCSVSTVLVWPWQISLSCNTHAFYMMFDSGSEKYRIYKVIYHKHTWKSFILTGPGIESRTPGTPWSALWKFEGRWGSLRGQNGDSSDCQLISAIF